MDKLIIKTLVELRIIVGYLGEKSQYNWWPSNFLAPTTPKMLEFTFPRTAQISQYMALSAAAAKVHDEAIGIGKSFHLFRLPEHIEKAMLEEFKMLGKDIIETYLSSKANATDRLTELSGGASISGEGPISIGETQIDKLDRVATKLACAYSQAFSKNNKAFPYFQSNI